MRTLKGASAKERSLETTLKKINASYIVDFFLGEYNFSLDTFRTHTVCIIIFFVSVCLTVGCSVCACPEITEIRNQTK